MIIGYDAKRAFCNRRGLGNYSRDVLRLMSVYYPEHRYQLYTPRIDAGLYVPDAVTSEVMLPRTFFGRKIPSLWRSYGIADELKHRHADIYHGLSQELPVGIEHTGVRSVVTMHDAIFVRYPELYDPFYRAIFIRKNIRSCRVADRIIAISEQTKRDIMEFFDADERKIDVVYQGCNNIFRQPVSGEAIAAVRARYDLPSSFLLTVGAIEPRKNQQLIIEAMHRSDPGMPLVIIGGATKYLQILQKKLKEYSLEKQVYILNNVSTADLPAIYRAASCMVYPSIFEGFGIPILEALCTGTPVVTSRGSCFEETGGKAALYTDPADADELADCLQRVLGDSELRQRMTGEGMRHSLLFTDQEVSRNLMNVYKRISSE
jgi:glycosyltransferase involved in cell wall biosynthesis